MKRVSALLFVLALAFGVSSTKAFAYVNYDYDSPLAVDLTITDLGGSSWQYDLSFDNTDTVEIWHFFVWTDESLTNVAGSFPNYGWYTDLNLVGTDYEYNAQNIDSGVNYIYTMWYSPPATSGNALAVGDSATFSFQTNYYDDSILYGYQTVDSVHAQTNGGTGYISAVGTAPTASVPEPSTLLLLGSGMLGLLAFRRRQSTV